MTTPTYDAVKRQQQWSPDELREPFDLRAVIASSYDTTKRRELLKLHGALSHVVERKRDAHGRFTR